MSITEMVEDWLKEYNRFMAELEDIRIQIDQIKESYNPEDVSAIDTTKEPISKTYNVSSGVERRVIPYVDRIRQLETRKKALERYIQRIQNAMTALTAEEKTLVERCLLDGVRYSQMPYSASKCYRLKKQALKKMAKILYGG